MEVGGELVVVGVEGGGGFVGQVVGWVGELGDDEFAVVFEGGVAVVEVLEAVAVDGEEFFVVAYASLGGGVVIPRWMVVAVVILARLVSASEEFASPFVEFGVDGFVLLVFVVNFFHCCDGVVGCGGERV